MICYVMLAMRAIVGYDMLCYAGYVDHSWV